MASIFPPCDERLLDAIRNASGAIIIAHKNPDGDAIASRHSFSTMDHFSEVI